jgi:hypothetical protein
MAATDMPENLPRDATAAGGDREAGDGNRGRRDRRRRGNRGDRPEAGGPGTAALAGETQVAGPAAQPEFPDSASERAPVPHVDSEPHPPEPAVPEPEGVAILEAIPASALPAPPAAAMPEVNTVAAAVTPGLEALPERRREAPVPVAPRSVAELPPVTLELPPDSGLVLVETSHRVEAALEVEPPPAAGPRRARRPRVQLADEPLQIVETRKDVPPVA